MGYLKKDETIFLRDDGGNLLPIDVEVAGLPGKPKIKALPITSGKFNELMSSSAEDKTKQDNQVILEHCVLPKYHEQEVDDMKSKTKAAIINAIMAMSLGKDQEELNNASKEKILEEEQKNLDQTVLE